MAKKLDMQSAHYEQGDATAGADLVAGELQTVGSVNGFPVTDVVNGDNYALITKSEKVEAEKVVGALGAMVPIFWVNATKNVAAAGDILIGFTNEAALSADTHVNINFDGALAYAKL